MSAYTAGTRQQFVDAACSALLDLLDAMQAVARESDEPEKWDDEYAGSAIDNCVDRMFCAPEAGMPKPSQTLSVRYHEVHDRAKPFLSEDEPLPGAVERLAEEIAAWVADSPDFASLQTEAHAAASLTQQIRESVARANELPAEKRVQLALMLGAPDDVEDATFDVEYAPGQTPTIKVAARMPVDMSRVKVDFRVVTAS